jgi:pimeloyl-ACP methyl ester carboxylesterase
VALDLAPVGAASVRLWTGGDGEPLVFLHGMDQHPGGAPFLEALARRHQVFAPELPGYGESGGFEGIEDLLDLVLFERRLIESWDCGPVDLVGHCLGGMVAAELAALCPWLVRSLVLVDAWGLWLDERGPADPYVLGSSELAAARWHDPATAPSPEPSLDAALVAGPHADPTEAALRRTQNLAVSTKFLWPIPERGLRKRLPLVDCPTLVVHGASDGLVPLAHAEALAALVPGARLAVVPEAGHLPHLERPEAFVDVVEAFLGD